MNLAPKIDQLAADPANKSGIVLGEDWIVPEGMIDDELRVRRSPGGYVFVNRSPLARKIITYNLLAMAILVFGVLYLNPVRESLMSQSARNLQAEAKLAAHAVEARLAGGLQWDGVRAMVADFTLSSDIQLFVFDKRQLVVASAKGPVEAAEEHSTLITDFLNGTWRSLSGLLTWSRSAPEPPDVLSFARRAAPGALAGEAQTTSEQSPSGEAFSLIAMPVMAGGEVQGVVVMASSLRMIDQFVRVQREQVLEMFAVAMVVSVGLSLILASTVASPLADLAAAAELGRDRNARKMAPGRIRIPDLTARPDEIGRLSGAMRGMVAALYDRIDANEQFAADVAHEIKNPLASLRSAVGTMRLTKRDDQREKLLNVIEHDVRRLDRLVSDISNASRLDSELVKEEAETFNLIKMLSNICDHLGGEAKEDGVDFISDLPDDAIVIEGLEARLAQVFVNLIENAISFCEGGDAVRVWTRRREDRVLVVVEDTGPGIPDLALAKVFQRFYSERPVGQFGNHSGLGLAISKQIVEAHGGVIWAENIRPTNADITSEPLGARFVVGLPV